MWPLQVVWTIYPLTDVAQCVGVVVGASVGVVSVLVLWTIQLHDADSVINVQITNAGYA